MLSFHKLWKLYETGNYPEQIKRLKNEPETADAFVIDPIFDYIKTCKYA